MLQVNKLLPSQGNVKYAVRLVSKKPLMRFAGMNICFVNTKGEAFLKRLVYVTDGVESVHEFEGPEITDIKHVLVAPETDKWQLGEVSVTTVDEHGKKEYLFPCEMTIGDQEMAAVLSDDVYERRLNAMSMKPVYDAEYMMMKEGLEVMTFEFTLVGGIMMALLYGIEKGYSFALGGSIGLMYLKLLEVGVDSVGTRKGLLFGSTAIRLGSIFALSAVVVTKYKADIDNDHWILLTGILGFTVYRMAMIMYFLKQK